MDSQHSLLCAGLRRADDFAAKAAAQIEAEEEAAAAEASGVAMDVAGSRLTPSRTAWPTWPTWPSTCRPRRATSAWEAAGAGMGPRAASLARFEAHARATNEVFLLAAQAVAHILLSLRRGVALEAAMAPFDAPPWWDAVAFDGSPSDEPSFRLQLRQLATDSWRLLVATLGADAPPGCALFVDVALYGVILGAFERRNCAVLVSSPVENYFLAVDDLDDGPQKEAVTAVTQPVLDALDDAYATPCEGIGLFPLQAMLNHSCEPNVSLQKGEDDEDDGRVVATVAAPVAAGTELCNAYIDVELRSRRGGASSASTASSACARALRARGRRRRGDRGGAGDGVRRGLLRQRRRAAAAGGGAAARQVEVTSEFQTGITRAPACSARAGAVRGPSGCARPTSAASARSRSCSRSRARRPRRPICTPSAPRPP